MVSITLKNLNKSFGSTPALKDVSLGVEPGELFFLLGPSGCGKTTLLRHLAGFYTPDSGEIHFGDNDVTRVPPHLRKTGMVFQSYALWPHMTVEKNVAFGLEERKIDKFEIEDRVAAALKLVEMEALGTRRIPELSGGQQQRVALARALVVKPDILLLDEPLSNLDARLRLDMRQEIRRLCKESGVTAIYVTHDQKEALAVADRLAVMNNGELLQAGTPREVYRNPQTTFVAGFMGETNLIAAHVEGGTSRDHLWSVATEAGRFWGRHVEANWAPRLGEKVTISIRPEAWTLVPFREIRNCLHGRLTRATYLGDTAQYELNADHLGPIRLSQGNPRVLHATDETVYHAAADPEDVVILRT
ncbi:MAG: ABC transporter ATP-binding protein [Verrucomicrobiales bacterium]